MSYWNSRGLRGSSLEHLINITNQVYREKNLAIIQKIPTPITPVKISKDTKNITLAYFSEKSTIDYIGAVQGIPVCFDAKEISKDFLPLRNVHAHQIDFMLNFEKQDGVAFFLVYFKMYNEYYYLPFKDLNILWEKSLTGGKKHIKYMDFDKKYLIKSKGKFLIHYLEALNTYLKSN